MLHRRRSAGPLAALRVLNEGAVPDAPASSALELSVRLQRLMLKLKSENMDEEGTRVDYAAARASSTFSALSATARELRSLQLDSLGSEAERRCLFINLYNALTIQGLAALDELPASPQDVKDFWNTTAYQVGTLTLTLNDMEHGILRGNGRQPAARAPHWPAEDPRASLLALPLDPRIHFALNCGARSCPPIRVYTPANLEQGLAAAAAGFLESETEVDESGVLLSSLLNWYGADFGSTQLEALATVARLLPAASAKRAALERLLVASASARPGLGAQLWSLLVAPVLPMFMPRGPVSVRFRTYDWALNKS